ncbi:hypothetical protein AWB79_03586 [Caballeronia hypogeia]|uniref:Uncharacterized protein n=1 Tax=Caballeronia hypogeia TaxID=1777140 RepID=A0A158BFR5_9BURK|nr:hypothetical protein AWB79_03586 [Caballeronia hypogeia]
MRIALAHEGIDLVGLRADLRFEPVRAISGCAKLLNKIEFFLARFTNAGLVSGGHAAQRIEFDEHRPHSPLGFLDGILDLLRVVFGVVTQFGLQLVDAFAQARGSRLLLLQALGKRFVLFFPPRDDFAETRLGVRSLATQCPQFGFQRCNMASAGVRSCLGALKRLFNCSAANFGIANLRFDSFHGGVDLGLIVCKSGASVLLGVIV